jgi:CubicO group peptidase (beta-lactamase class C family)
MARLSDAQHAAIADLIPELDRLAADSMADWKVPGAAIAVVQDGELAFAKAYGHRHIEANLQTTAATQFLIGSITDEMILHQPNGTFVAKRPEG